MTDLLSILHEWPLEKFGRQQAATENNWAIKGNHGLTVRLLTSRTLLICTPDETLESISLFNSKLWLKCLYKNDSMLIVQKMPPGSRKMRLMFKPVDGKSAEECCLQCAEVFKRYMFVDTLGETAQTALIQEECPSPDVEIASDHRQIVKVITEDPLYRLNRAYQASSIPTEDLDILVQLILMDPGFPAFVDSVEQTINSIVESD